MVKRNFNCKSELRESSWIAWVRLGSSRLMITSMSSSAFSCGYKFPIILIIKAKSRSSLGCLSNCSLRIFQTLDFFGTCTTGNVSNKSPSNSVQDDTSSSDETAIVSGKWKSMTYAPSRSRRNRLLECSAESSSSLRFRFCPERRVISVKSEVPGGTRIRNLVDLCCDLCSPIFELWWRKVSTNRGGRLDASSMGNP